MSIAALLAGLVASTHQPLVAQQATFGPYVRDGYGLGWQTGRYGEAVLIHHFGNFAGSRAHVSFMPPLAATGEPPGTGPSDHRAHAARSPIADATSSTGGTAPTRQQQWRTFQAGQSR